MTVESFDQAAFAALNMSAASPGAIASLEALAVVPAWLLPPLLAGIWLVGRRDDRASAVSAGLAAGLALAAAHFTSLAVDHPRPFVAGLAPNLLGHAPDSSFPSDHATLFFALAAAFAHRPVSGLPGLAWVLAALGLAVGLARVALGVHFPLDVAGSVVIGGMVAAVSDRVLPRVVAVLYDFGERIRRTVTTLTRRATRRTGKSIDARPAR